MDTKVISTGVRYTSIPESYIRPESDRPRLSEVDDCQDVPVIDLGNPNRALTVQQVGEACLTYGFFQVINHGVSGELVEKMLAVADEFFQMPVEEKMKHYSDDPAKTMRLSTSFNVKKETVHNWRDYLRLHCHPLDKYAPEWPSNPSSFKSVHAGTPSRQMDFRWHPPMSGLLKLNVDAAVCPIRQRSAGGAILRNSNGQFVMALAFPMIHHSDPLTAEAMAVSFAVEKLHHRGFCNFAIETDSKTLVDYLRRREKGQYPRNEGKNERELLLSRCLPSINSSNLGLLNWCRKDQNTPAHKLARLGLDMNHVMYWAISCPYIIYDVWALDNSY